MAPCCWRQSLASGAICFLVAVLTPPFSTGNAQKQKVWLSSIQPFTGTTWPAGLSMRVGADIILEEINSNSDLLPGFDLKVVWQDGLCNGDTGTNVFLDNIFLDSYMVFAPGIALGQLDANGDGTITTSDVESLGMLWNSTLVTPSPVGLLGPGCSGTAMGINRMAVAARWPVVSNSATRPVLSNRSMYPMFFRTIMPDTAFNAAWVAMAKALGHRSISAVCGETENWGSMVESLVAAAASRGVALEGLDLSSELPGFRGYQIIGDSQGAAAQVAGSLRSIRQRLVILHMFAPRNRLLLCEAYKLGFVNVVWMVMGWLPIGWWAEPDTDCAPVDVTRMAVGFISANVQLWRSDAETRLDCSHTMTVDGFKAKWLTIQNMSALDDLGKRPEGYTPALEASTTADAVCMYAQMLHQLLVVRNISLELLSRRTPEAYAAIQELFAATDFEGVSGRIRFGEGRADPDGSVVVQQMQSSRLADIATYQSGELVFLGLGSLTFGLPGEMIFAGPAGATALTAELGQFQTCSGDLVLNFSSNVCEACPHGEEFVDILGGCICTAGYAVSHDVCAECSPGTFAAGPGSLMCDNCTVGRYAPHYGATACARCPAGSYASVESSTSCANCPHTFTTAGEGSESRAECVCGVGTRFGGAGACEDCGDDDETGIVCLGNNDIRIKVGFFAADASLSVFQCFGDFASIRCPGGRPGNACASGRRGLTCAECEEGFKVDSEGGCSPCSESGWSIVLFVFACLALLVCMVGLYALIDRRGAAPQSHMMLLCALSFSMAVTILQTLSVLGAFKQIQWPDPMLGLLRMLQVLTFDVEVINVGCIAHLSPLGRFVGKVSIMAVCVIIVVLVHLVVVLSCSGRSSRERMPSLIACIGTIFSVFFISVISSVLGPVQCLENPNGKWTSQAYPSLVCWESEEHWAMVGVSMFALAAPLGYLAKCCQVVWAFPAAMDAGRVEHLVAYSFLFFRYKAEAYWYSLVQLFRGLALAMLPVVPNVAAQLLFMMLILTVQLICIVAYMPWRTHNSNYIDVYFTVSIQSVAFIGAFYIDSRPGPLLAWCAMVVVTVAVLIAPIIGAVAAWHHFHNKWRKDFQYFLCHHKAGAGAMARVLKLHLQRHDTHVFIDCDNLTNLDSLFDQVANRTETLVIVGSPCVFSRIWCVGEIATAKMNKLQVIKLALPGFSDPQDDFIDDFAARVSDLSPLTNRGISIKDAQLALRWVRTLKALHVGLNLNDQALRDVTVQISKPTTFLRQISKAVASSMIDGENPSLNGIPSVRAGSTPSSNLSTTQIVRDEQNLEATAAALVLTQMMTPLFAHCPKEIPQVLPHGGSLPIETRKIILLCSNGTFEKDNVFYALFTAVGTKARCFPVTVDEGFQYPTPSFVAEHHAIAIRVSDSSEEADALVKDVLNIFKTIAVSFFASMASESELSTKAREVADRLLATNRAVAQPSFHDRG